MAGPGRNVSRYLLPARQQVGKLGNFCKMRALADLADRWFLAFAKIPYQDADTLLVLAQLLEDSEGGPRLDAGVAQPEPAERALADGSHQIIRRPLPPA